MFAIRNLLIGGVVLLGVVAAVIHQWRKRGLNAREEFAQSAQAFSGLYEPLYRIATGAIKYRPGVIGDWATRTANLGGAPHYRERWLPKLADCTNWDQHLGAQKAAELLAFVRRAGVARGASAEMVVNALTYKRYATDDGTFLETGQTARVQTPYWSLGERILEKGIIKGGKAHE